MTRAFRIRVEVGGVRTFILIFVDCWSFQKFVKCWVDKSLVFRRYGVFVFK